MRRLVRIVIVVVVLSVLAVAVVGYLQTQSNRAVAQAPAVEDETVVGLSDMTVTVSATGAITPIQQVGLAFELSSPVNEILVHDGQAVKAGDVLARLDASELAAALTNAQIALAAQQATFDALITPAREVDIAAAEASLTAAQAQAGAASLGADANQVEVARIQAEIARNQLWQAQLNRDMLGGSADTVTGTIKQAENNVELSDITATGEANQGADVASLTAANAQIVAAEVQLDRLKNGPSEIEIQIADTQLQISMLSVEQAQANFSRSELIAPFDGIVANNKLVIGEAPPQGEAMQLIDLSGFYVDVAVDETDIVEVMLGQRVEVNLDALPESSITGKVTRIAVTPDRASQLVTYVVRVTLDPTQEPLRTGMTATTTIIVNELRDALTLPNRFIRIDRATQQAFVTVERTTGKYEDIPVMLGVRNESESQVVSGLAAGDRVVLLPRETFNPLS